MFEDSVAGSTDAEGVGNPLGVNESMSKGERNGACNEMGWGEAKSELHNEDE